jgi:hypothetical protein
MSNAIMRPRVVGQGAGVRQISVCTLSSGARNMRFSPESRVDSLRACPPVTCKSIAEPVSVQALVAEILVESIHKSAGIVGRFVKGGRHQKC